MICNNNCDYFVDGERSYCSMSGLAVSEGMSCIEKRMASFDDDDDFDEDE